MPKKKLKSQAYKDGEYKVPTPPVPTTGWDEEAWIKYIDACDGWTVPTKPPPIIARPGVAKAKSSATK